MALPGDSVLVESGTYLGDYITFSGKDIYLSSRRGPGSVEVKGRSGTQVFDLSNGEGPNCVVRGFTVSSSTFGIWTTGSPVIRDNVVVGTENVGVLVGGGGSPLIRENAIVNNLEQGIHVDNGSAPTIEGNLIYGNGREGIVVAYPAPVIIRDNIVMANGRFWGIAAGTDVLVTGNLVIGNTNGVRSGGEVTNNVVLYSEYTGLLNGNTNGPDPVKRNNVVAGSNVGIRMEYPWTVVMENNVVTGCGTGLLVEMGGDPHVVRNNVITGNGWGVYCDPGVQEIDLSYNDVWGSTSGDYHNCTPDGGSGLGGSGLRRSRPQPLCPLGHLAADRRG